MSAELEESPTVVRNTRPTNNGEQSPTIKNGQGEQTEKYLAIQINDKWALE